MSSDMLLGYPIFYVNDMPVPKCRNIDIELANLASWLESDLHREDWPEFYRQRCERIANVIRNLEQAE